MVVGNALVPTARGTLLTDHTNSSGDVGGALINDHGELVGLILPGQGPNGALRAAPVETVRALVDHRHPPVALGDLDRFLKGHGTSGIRDPQDNAYNELFGDVDDDDANDSTFSQRGSRRRGEEAGERDGAIRSSSTCLLGSILLGLPIAMVVGSCAAVFGVCSIYGCARSLIV